MNDYTIYKERAKALDGLINDLFASLETETDEDRRKEIRYSIENFCELERGNAEVLIDADKIEFDKMDLVARSDMHQKEQELESRKVSLDEREQALEERRVALDERELEFRERDAEHKDEIEKAKVVQQHTAAGLQVVQTVLSVVGTLAGVIGVAMCEKSDNGVIFGQKFLGPLFGMKRK